MKSVNDWVATAAFIEYFVLEEALQRNVSIENASSIVVPKFGLRANGPFMHRQTRLLGMLYTLLVFPREHWGRKGLIDMVLERAHFDAELSAENKTLLDKNLLRSIRNAVSHARIDFTNDTVTFRDGKSEAAPSFEATFVFEEALNLLLVLGRAFHECAQVEETLTKFAKGKQ